MQRISDFASLSGCFGFMQKFRDEVIRSWQKENLDAVICPPFACTAMPLGSSSELVCKL